MITLFEDYAARQLIPRKALEIIQIVAVSLNHDPEIVIYPAYPEPIKGTGPWICFNIRDRKFGIWTATMALYEQEADGSMGLDALEPSTQEPIARAV
jgi:hypothetical protein